MSMASWRQMVVRLAKLLRLFRIEDTVIARLVLHSPSHHQEYELFVLNETTKDLLLVKCALC